MRDIAPVPRGSTALAPKIDFGELERAAHGYDLPGKPHVDYTIPGPELIDGALLDTILFRGGSPDRVFAPSTSRSMKHAHLVALVMLGDRDAAAYLKGKGFLTPAPLVPPACACIDLADYAEGVAGDALPKGVTEVFVRLDLSGLSAAIERIQSRIRSLVLLAYLRARGRVPKRNPWTFAISGPEDENVIGIGAR